MMDAISTLQANLSRLNSSDQRFARSLLASPRLSEKQHFWIGKLIQRATTPTEPAPLPQADLSAILHLFETAGGKRAAIVFETPDGTAFRLSLAGPRASQPGTISVTDTAPYGSNIWFGRIGLDGKFQPSRAAAAQRTTAVVAALEAFAADPEGQAAAYGHRTGSCCFCSRALDNDFSKALGYGPVCARRWGLGHSYTRPIADAASEPQEARNGGFTPTADSGFCVEASTLGWHTDRPATLAICGTTFHYCDAALSADGDILSWRYRDATGRTCTVFND